MKLTAKRFTSAVKRVLKGGILVRNTCWMLGGRGVRMAIQAVYFLLIARTLGANQYGVFVAAVALVALLTPFSSWGTGFLMMREVARDRTAFEECWGTALGTTVVSGSMLLIFVLIVWRVFLAHSMSLQITFLIGFSDLIVARTVDLATQAFMAVEVLRKSAEVNVVLSIARVLGAAYLMLQSSHATAASWSWLYLLSGIVAGVYSYLAVCKSIGPPKWRFWLSRSERKDGFYFALSQASQTAYNDIDKTMLVKLGGAAATGIYGAAYRIIDVSFAPIGSLVYATYSRFFRHGANGITDSVRFARRLLSYASVYGIIAALLLFLAAPLLPFVLGLGFAPATAALQWLSPLVMLKSVHYFLANSLTTSGFQNLTATVQLGVAAFNIVINLWLIPAYSWRGAAWASLASDSVLLVGLFIAIWFVRARDNRIAIASAAEQNVLV